MAVDFRELRYQLNKLDLWSVEDRKDLQADMVQSLSEESLRALALMAAKRHTVKNVPADTKTFGLLENIIKGLHSADCSDLAKQAIAIAPTWMIETVIIASVNRFNTVDQNALREAVTALKAESDEEVSPEAIAEAERLAEEAAARAAAIERGEVVPDDDGKNTKGKKASTKPEKKKKRGFFG